MQWRFVFPVVILYASFVGNLRADPLNNPVARYPGIKAAFDRQLAGAVTADQNWQLYRDTVAQGRYSGRPMLTRMLGNFERDVFKLPKDTPGLSTTVRLLASDNRNVVLGNARTLKYATELHADGRFRVEGLNRPRKNLLGATDADIVFRHSATGSRIRMEVKNVTIASQRANLAKLKDQLRKMSVDSRNTGEIQVWANRRQVLPEIRKFANQLGVRVVGQLRTGQSSPNAGDVPFDRFCKDLDKECMRQHRTRLLSGGMQLGFGGIMVYQSIGQIQNELTDFQGSRAEWLRIGEHSSILAAGTGFVVGGTAQLISPDPRRADKYWLRTAARWGTRIGIASLVFAEGFVISQYMMGDLQEREFWHTQAMLAGGLAGSAAGTFSGTKVGGVVGGFIGGLIGNAPGAGIGFSIGAAIGGVGGGIGGAYAGSHFAGVGVQRLYEFKDENQRERYAQFLLKHYQVR